MRNAERDAALDALVEEIQGNVPTPEQREQLHELLFVTLIPENGCICPLCGTPVVYGEPQRYETLGEHVSCFGEEYVSPIRKTVECPNLKCPASAGWWGCEEGGFYDGWGNRPDGITWYIPNIIQPWDKDDLYTHYEKEQGYTKTGKIRISWLTKLRIWWAKQAVEMGIYEAIIEFVPKPKVIVYVKKEYQDGR